MPETKQINPGRMPEHIAIIMDGNGRWAKKHGKPRTYGHQIGVESVRVVTEEAARAGIKYLTLYTFSTENWNRPEEEVNALIELLIDSIEDELFMKNNISFRAIGDLKKFPQRVQNSIQKCINDTSRNTGMCLVLALSYSSRWEITEAVKTIASQVKEDSLSLEQIEPELFASELATNFMPDPDLLIRTGGEIRLSNYLLWQCAYSELYFTETYWPDFRKDEFFEAIAEYQKRERRFGKTSEQISLTDNNL